MRNITKKYLIPEMIVYCAMPIRGDTTYREFYNNIIEEVNNFGHTALSELNNNFKSAEPLSDNEIFIRDINWINKSEVVIAEISGPSTGVGFEIAYALYEKKIPVLALANTEAGNKISAMINGCSSELLVVERYNDSKSQKKIIADFLKKYSA
jgi:2'-deoxynucleoside 5'-phosphate N-hydrolase